MKLTVKPVCLIVFMGLSLIGCSTERPASRLASTDQSVTIGTAKIEAWGRAYTNSCGYYSNTVADIDITIRDTSIQWGETPALHSGLSLVNPAQGQSKTWEQVDTSAMPSIDQATWKIRKSITLAERGSPKTYDSLSFIIEVPSHPNAGTRYIKPGAGNSYWNVSFDLGSLSCRGSEDPQMNPLKLTPVFE